MSHEQGSSPRTLKGVLACALLSLNAVGCRPREGKAADAETVRRGRSLYQRGESARGEPLVGLLGPEAVELSGAVAACARCHGPAGRGSLEGGVEVPDIRPRVLGHPRSRAVGEVEEHSRPAYTRETLLRALTEGISPSGRRLGMAMPRFVLGEAEREELLAYLGQLGVTAQPGVTPTTLTLGAALPLSGPLAPVGEDVAAVLRAALEEVNTRGGIYRRRLVLKVVEVDGTGQLLQEGVLALVASLWRGQPESTALLRREGVPLVLPLVAGEAGREKDGPFFFLYMGESEQARLAVQYLAQGGAEEGTLRRRPLWVVRSEDDEGQAWARAVREEAKRRELPAPVELGVEQATRVEVLRRWGEAAPAAILYSGPGAGLRSLGQVLEAAKVEATGIAPARLAEPWVVEGLKQPVLFVYPPGVEQQEEHRQAFAAFMSRHQLQPRHMAFQLQAYASVQVLVEALKRVGAEVTQEELVAELERLRDFPTGVTPPVTFGVNRRVGVLGAQLVRVEGGLRVAASPWVALSP
jgi:ABC-type branched-subunit amino acid transport system substrate-binding protein